MQKKFVSLIFLWIFMVPHIWAQPQEVSGRVTDASQEPIIGANVIVRGTNRGTVTNSNGEFAIHALPEDILEVSFLGYNTATVPVNSTTYFSVSLHSEVTPLEQVVVTGYSTQRRADLTGAVSVVNMDDVLNAGENNVMKALQGRVPGLMVSADGNPGGKVGIQIRGISNLETGNADLSKPLIVIDGIPTEGGMHELNPNDIESIQVLKDASSASIYGSRASNGVIIVTTRQGRSGRMQVNFDTYRTYSYYANRTKVLNAEQYGQAMWRAIVNNGMDPNVVNSIGYRYDWNYDAGGNPVLNGVSVPKYLDRDRLMPSSDTDWFDEVSRVGVAQSYNLSVSGGTDKMLSQFSFNYYDNQGLLKNTYFERFSARINNSYKLLGDIITIGENLSVNRTRELEADTNDVLDLAMQAHPLIPVYMTDGNWGGPSSGMNDRHNPVRVLHANKNNPYTYWRIFGNAYMNINPVRGLNIKTNFGIDYGNFYKRLLTRSYVSGEQFDEDRTAAELQQRHWRTWTWSNTATYNFEVGRSRFAVLAGMELSDKNDIEFATYKEGFEIQYPNYMWPDAGVGDALSYGNSTGFSLASYFAKVDYIFDNKYLVSGTIRRDGSSRFGKNNRWGTFPAFSAGWRISEENFMRGADRVVSDLKIRAGWGQTGNQNTISNFAAIPIYTSDYGGSGNDGGGSTGTAYDIHGNGSGLLPSGFRKTMSGNDDLKWETSTQTNIGMDFTLFTHSLYGSLDFYKKKTKDMLAMVYYPAASGEGSSHWANGASMENKGVEFMIGYRGRTRFGMSYDITGNIAANRNKVTALPESLINTYGGNGVDDNILGRSIYSIYGYVADGLFRTQEEVDSHVDQSGKGLGRIRFANLNDDNTIDANDRTWIGSSEPNFTYGLNINLAWKNFDLSAFFQGVAGGKVFNSLKKRTDFWAVDQTGSNKGTRLLNAWSPANTSSDIPALSYTDDNWEERTSTYYLENQSYMKLKNLQLGYTIPAHLTRKIKIERLRVYISGYNLFTIKSKEFTGVDPENVGWGYPIPRSFNMGLNLTF